jgi:hypothetical protein
MVPRAVAHATAAVRTSWTNCSCVRPAPLTPHPLPRRASSRFPDPRFPAGPAAAYQPAGVSPRLGADRLRKGLATDQGAIPSPCPAASHPSGRTPAGHGLGAGATRTGLSAATKAVVAHLDLPLNLMGMSSSDIRRTLRQLRRALATAC